MDGKQVRKLIKLGTSLQAAISDGEKFDEVAPAQLCRASFFTH